MAPFFNNITASGACIKKYRDVFFQLFKGSSPSCHSER